MLRSFVCKAGLQLSAAPVHSTVIAKGQRRNCRLTMADHFPQNPQGERFRMFSDHVSNHCQGGVMRHSLKQQAQRQDHKQSPSASPSLTFLRCWSIWSSSTPLRTNLSSQPAMGRNNLIITPLHNQSKSLPVVWDPWRSGPNSNETYQTW